MITLLTIGGMKSVHCTRAVFTALTAVEGIARADVTIGRAVIEHDGRATPEHLRAAVATAGYDVVRAEVERWGLPVV